MNRFSWSRAAAAVAGLAASPVALADGGVTATGWWSLAAILGVVGLLVAVHRKLS